MPKPHPQRPYPKDNEARVKRLLHWLGAGEALRKLGVSQQADLSYWADELWEIPKLPDRATPTAEERREERRQLERLAVNLKACADALAAPLGRRVRRDEGDFTASRVKGRRFSLIKWLRRAGAFVEQYQARTKLVHRVSPRRDGFLRILRLVKQRTGHYHHEEVSTLLGAVLNGRGPTPENLRELLSDDRVSRRKWKTKFAASARKTGQI